MTERSRARQDCGGSEERTENMATAKSNGFKFKRVERKRAKFWKPCDDNPALVVRMIERILPLEGARVQRARWLAEVLDDGEDLSGPLKAGERIAIGESVVLADLLSDVKPGQVVRISTAGLDGRVKLFNVEVAE